MFSRDMGTWYNSFMSRMPHHILRNTKMTQCGQVTPWWAVYVYGHHEIEEMSLSSWGLGLPNNLKPLDSITQCTYLHTCRHTHTPHTEKVKWHVWHIHQPKAWGTLGWPNLADGSFLLCGSTCDLLDVIQKQKFPRQRTILWSPGGDGCLSFHPNSQPTLHKFCVWTT